MLIFPSTILIENFINALVRKDLNKNCSFLVHIELSLKYTTSTHFTFVSFKGFGAAEIITEP